MLGGSLRSAAWSCSPPVLSLDVLQALLRSSTTSVYVYALENYLEGFWKEIGGMRKEKLKELEVNMNPTGPR